MRTSKTRVRRGTRIRRSHPSRTRQGRPTRTRQGRPTRTRQGRPTRTRERAMTRRHSARRRSRYGRCAPMSQLSIGKAFMAAILAGFVVLALAAYLMTRPPIRAAGVVQFIYTAPTANDATIILPAAVQNELLQIGLAHRSIALTRVGFTGEVSTSPVDMTPRAGNRVLKVTGRAVPVIDAKISAIEKAINSPAVATGGGQALYAGLTRTNFTGAPVTIISTGLDLANPDNFRALNWSVPPEAVVANVKKAGVLPALHGPVTFVLVPTAGPQPQLGQAQKNYLKAVWTSLLTAAGATSVRFIDATGTAANSGAPSAPTVAVPGLPVTPIPPVHQANNKVTCTVPASYFIVNTPELIDTAQTEQALTHCISAALAAHATFALDGWTSYEGPLTASGKPAVNYAVNRQLSKARVRTIADLLVDDLGVSRSAITRLTGHGNFDQPNPDPSSPANRVVIITYTTK
jgi:hypothetical protein